MATQTLANRMRPHKFGDVMGQEGPVSVLLKVVQEAWRPNAIAYTGPFGTGKTTLARLTARALLCDGPTYSNAQVGLPENLRGKPYEPCGVCESCVAMDNENHPNYVEVDAASQGAVNDVRAMKDMVQYRTGDKIKVIVYDESHMLSTQAQNALLQILEEGQENVMFGFCTTEAGKMLPTIMSRCIELQMRLLKTDAIAKRMAEVAKIEGIDYEPKALSIIATYVRGHARDSMVFLEQLSKMAPVITEDLVRQFLKLDRYVEVYKLLCERDKKAAFEQLESLLCNMAASDLSAAIGEVLINGYRLTIGIDNSTATDKAWLQRVVETRGKDSLLPTAEAVLTLPMDYATINLGIASIGNILLADVPISTRPGGPVSSLRPQSSSPAIAMPGQGFRKPGT
jgi:DNA polymerase-3 subunit gamma/tau